MTQKEELQKAVSEGMEPMNSHTEGEPNLTEGYEENSEPGEMYQEPDKGGIMGRLMNNEPNPDLDQVDLTPDTRNGGIPRIVRAVNKIMGGDLSPDKPPAIFDLILGAYEFVEQKDLMKEVQPNKGDSVGHAKTPEPSKGEERGGKEVTPDEAPNF